MLNLCEEPSKLQLLRLEEVLGGVHGHDRNAQLLSTGRDLQLVLSLHPVRYVGPAALDTLVVQMQFQPALRKIQHPSRRRLTHQRSQAVPVSWLGQPQVHIPVQALEDGGWPPQVERLPACADLHRSSDHLSEDIVTQSRQRLLL